MTKQRLVAGLLLAPLGAVFGAKAWARLRLSRAKHRSLAGHPRTAKRFARQMPFYEFDGEEFFRADDAPDGIVRLRRAGFAALSDLFATRFAKTNAFSGNLKDSISDIQFTSRYRVPYQFSRIVRENLPTGAVYERSEGIYLFDLDGNRLIDLTGSYGVNLLGTDTYKRLVDEGIEATRALGPVLGGFHPVIANNVGRLKKISGLDEVSFHMSGTEAVMQAVRLARYHTQRTHLVRFSGAYHGWWGDVQPGIGNPIPADHTYTLAEMSDVTLKVLATRKNIACVLVNPLQAMHPNRNAPGDSTLVLGRKAAGGDREAYAIWLAKLSEVCRKAGIVLIVDEVFTGFRLAPRGACQYFGIAPDMVTYGKTLGGGLPVGVLCGKAKLMKRFKEDRPADICFARGTFNSHPYVMGAMDAFLSYIESDEGCAIYDGLDERWNARAAMLNRALAEAGAPVEIANLGTIFSIAYTQPSRYHWMFQYYLRAQDLALSWVGSGRLIFNLGFGDDDFGEVCERFVAAARAMTADGWWWSGDRDDGKALQGKLVREVIASKLGQRSVSDPAA